MGAFPTVSISIIFNWSHIGMLCIFIVFLWSLYPYLSPAYGGFAPDPIGGLPWGISALTSSDPLLTPPPDSHRGSAPGPRLGTFVPQISFSP